MFFSKKSDVFLMQNQMFFSGVVVINTVQLHSAMSELRFCVGSNPVCGMSEIYNGENL